jgi:DNA-binding transcriptional ArsR family regulator
VADRSTARRAPARQEERASPLEPVAGEAGPAASLALDRLIHERVRLAIVSALAATPTLTFAELKQVLGTTDGNLSVHARKLEEAGYLDCRKSFVGRLPRTEYALTDAGRAALGRYVAHMEDLIRMMKGDEG